MKRTRDAGKASVAIVVVIAILAAAAVGGWLWHNHKSADQAVPKKPTFSASDGSAKLFVPKDALSTGTKVTFTPQPAKAKDVNKNARGVTSAGTPVDIHVTQGSLSPKKVTVTLKYDPHKIPRGLSYKQVSMVVFDTNLDAWVPILDAKVNASDHTVTATAPHFSLYDTVVLNPSKQIVHVGGQTIRTVINGATTVKAWLNEFVRQLSGDLIKDLFGVAPKLSCDPRSQSVTAKTKSVLNRLTACTEQTRSSDTTVRMRNGFAFPLRSQKLPKTMALRFDDVWNNGSDLVNLARSTYWSFRHQTVLTGANLSSMTATSNLKQETVEADVDIDAIPYDILLSALMAVAPEQALVKDALKSAIKSGKLEKGKPGSAGSWATAVFDGFDCIVNAAHQPSPKEAFTRNGMKWAADTAHDCLGTILSNFNLEGALASMLDFIKVIPEVIESTVYGLFETAKQQITQGGFDTTSVTVTRDPFASIEGEWYIGATNVSILKIDSSGHSTLRVNAGPCIFSSAFDGTNTVPMCDSITNITFVPNSNGRFTGTYGTTKIVGPNDGPAPAGTDATGPTVKVGDTFTMQLLGPNAIKTSSGGPGNPYVCRAGKWSNYSHCG